MPTPLKSGVTGFYNDKGEVQFTHTAEGKADLAKKGFKFPRSPIVLEWPKDIYHTSGRSRQVASQAAMDALGEGWSFDAPPEKLPEQRPAPGTAAQGVGGASDAVITAFMNEVKVLNTRLEGIELAGEQQAETIVALEARVKELEALIMEPAK